MYGMSRFFGDSHIPGWTVQLALDQEIKNSLQIFIGSGAELNCEVHALRCARVLRAAASLASSWAKTSSAAMPLTKR